MAVSGKYAYIADDNKGLMIVDISDPRNLQLVSRYDTAGSSRGVAVSDGYAYIADGNKGLVIVDISDPENPMEEGHYDTAGDAFGVVVIGSYAYVADSYDDLVIVDISDPGNPTERGHYDTASFAYGLVVRGKYAYIGNWGSGLVILELHFPPDAALHVSADNVRVTNITVRNSSHTGVLVDADNVEIQNCKVTGNNVGIRVINGSEHIVIHDCNIFENHAGGLNAWFNDGITVSTINNWWGDPSGPYHSTLNPDGLGNIASDNLIFDPWLTLPFDYRVHYVSISGDDTSGIGEEENPYKTIQKAIDMANEWDTIKVASGTFSESITVNKRFVTVIGDSPETTILDAGGATTVVLITADNVHLDSFAIRNATENGILITDSAGVKIIDCAFPENSNDLNLTNSMDIQLINSTFETVNFNDASSSITVLWLIDLKITDNRSGLIPNAHAKITDAFGTTEFNGYTDEEGKILQINVIDYYQNLTSRLEYNPCTISIWKDGYLNFEEENSINSFTRLTYQLQTHILPESIISGDIVRKENMDHVIDFDGYESAGREITYYWEFGDGDISTSQNPSHTYTFPGVYQVNLTVTDDYDNSSTSSIALLVENFIPIARIESDTDYTFEDNPIEFSARDSWDTISDSLTFLWDFGDNTDSSEVSPIHVYQDEGEYTVALTTTDMFGGESKALLSITVTNIEPWIIETNVTGMHYPGKPLRFVVTADDTSMDLPSLEYKCDFGDGTIAYEQNVTHVYREAGMFNVTITVTDNNGASDSAGIQIIISDPQITTSVSSTSTLQDKTVFFNASHELDDGSFNYTWYFADGTTAEEQEASHIYPMSGTFTPWLKINDGTENTTIFLQEVIVSNVVPVPIIITDKLSVSEDESVHFDASTSWDSPTNLPNLIYTWDFGDGTIGGGIDVTHAYSEMGSYSVMLTVNDGKLTNSTQVEIEVENVPPIANGGAPKEQEVAVGIPVILDASQSMDTESDFIELNYTWKINDMRVYGEIVSFTFETAGSFSVILEVRDNNGAVSNDTLTFEVTKSLESDDDELMNTLSWILVVIIIVILVVIGYLINWIRDDELIIKMVAEQAAEEETVVIEGEMKNDEFKPKDEVQETTVEVVKDQEAEMVEAEVEEVGEEEKSDEMFKHPDDGQEVTSEVAVDEDKKMSDIEVEVEGSSADNEKEMIGEEREDTTK